MTATNTSFQTTDTLLDVHQSVLGSDMIELLEEEQIDEFFHELSLSVPHTADLGLAEKVTLIEFADDSDSTGYSFGLTDGTYVYILDRHYASSMFDRLNIDESESIVVFKDTREQDGPFLGDADIVTGTLKTFNEDSIEVLEYAVSLMK